MARLYYALNISPHPLTLLVKCFQGSAMRGTHAFLNSQEPCVLTEGPRFPRPSHGMPCVFSRECLGKEPALPRVMKRKRKRKGVGDLHRGSSSLEAGNSTFLQGRKGDDVWGMDPDTVCVGWGWGWGG